MQIQYEYNTNQHMTQIRYSENTNMNIKQTQIKHNYNTIQIQPNTINTGCNTNTLEILTRKQIQINIRIQ